MGPKTFEMEMDASVLSNLSWARLSELMDDGLSKSRPDTDAISEAELLLQFKRAIAVRSDFVMIRLRYNESEGV